jgi:hypothetical protein
MGENMTIEGYIVLILFYGGLFAWFFWLVRRNIHPSRSLLLGYVGSLAIMAGLLFAVVFLVMLVSELTGIVSVKPGDVLGKALVGAGVGGIFATIFAGWEICKAWLSRPSRRWPAGR